MLITDEIIRYVAALSRLEIGPDDMERTKADLSRIITHMYSLSELDTEGVEPMSHVIPLKNVLREDVRVERDNREELLSNAPEQKDGCFKVPKTVE